MTSLGSSESVDAVVRRVRENAATFARLSISERISLLEAVREGYYRIADGVTRAACAAKGEDPNSPALGEEWIADPVLVLRNLKLLILSLQDIQKHGAPQFDSSSVRKTADGRMSLRVFPCDPMDAALLARHEAWVRFLPEIKSEADIRAQQAPFYQRPHAGKVVAVLGAGNVNSIPTTDALYKMFVEGMVCVLKMNPVNDYAGPYLERAFQPLISRGFFGTVYGGPDVGKALVSHPGVDEIHMTGSDRTHDTMLWGPPGPEREERKRNNTPLLTKRLTSELGNITPVLVVPGRYSEKELEYQARNVAGMTTHNASFDCTSAKVLVLAKDWPQRETFLQAIQAELKRVPLRKAYYPGAEARWKNLTEGRSKVERIGQGQAGELPWAFIRELQADSKDEPLFQQEPWCAILTETALPGADAESFLAKAVGFANERLWGTLCASVIFPSSADARLRDYAAVNLRYGTVAFNTWSSVGFGVGVTPWGGHPSATLQDIQSGLGFVHNTLMLQGIEKTIIEAPLKMFPVPPWFPNYRTLTSLGKRLAALEYAPSWLKVPAVAFAAMRA